MRAVPTGLPALLLALLAAPAVAAAEASPLGLAWGAVAEPAAAGELSPGRLAEHLEFLQAHGWTAVRARDAAAAGAGGGGRAVLLTFDDPASAWRYALPLLDLYRMPAVVTVGPAQAADPALAPALAGLAASPWVELVPRVEAADLGEPAAAGEPAVRCAPGAAAPEASAGSREERLARFGRALAAQAARLREIAGAPPAGVAWAPGAWDGEAEAVAAGLGLTLSLPAFTAMPPALAPPRVARYAVPSWAGIWALAQAAVRWDPRDHPVRFVEVDAAWICAGGDPPARLARVAEVIRRLGLNGARLRAGGPEGAWFPTAAAPVRGDVAGPLARALRRAGVRWLIVDVPGGGDPQRGAALARDLARAVDADVAVLPAGGEGERLAAAVRGVRPAARLAWREATRAGRETGDRAFRLAPAAPGGPEDRGLTVGAAGVAAADDEAARRAVAGWEWIGLPVELAEAGLRTSLRALASFVLPR